MNEPNNTINLNTSRIKDANQINKENTIPCPTKSNCYCSKIKLSKQLIKQSYTHQTPYAPHHQSSQCSSVKQISNSYTTNPHLNNNPNNPDPNKLFCKYNISSNNNQNIHNLNSNQLNSNQYNFDQHNSKCHNPNQNTNLEKRTFLNICIKFMTLIGIYYFFSSLLKTMFPNSDILESEYLYIDLDEISEGETITKYWQGKPIFIKHRTAEEIYIANNTNLNTLKDPEQDNHRVKQFQEKWLVMIGICTHLGCIPIHNKGSISGGWLCPCHNSEYDTSGRVISGPALKNLVIPPYKFTDNNQIRIG